MKAKFCVRCGHYIANIGAVKGSFGVEVLLWILLLPVGIIYSVWRLVGRSHDCPGCGIPVA